MADPIPLSASDLRQAMRDPRYWQPGHPERADYHAWVGDAFQRLHGADGERSPDGLVWVRPYTRSRDGETEEVIGHLRHARPRDGRDGGGGGGRVTVEDDPGGEVVRRYTARDESGALIGRCETLGDGSQFCTLAMPDGGVVVEGLEAGEAEFTPVTAPAQAVERGLATVLTPVLAFFYSLRDRLANTPPGDTAPDTPFMLLYRGFEGTNAEDRATVGTLTQERVEQFCPRTAEFTELLNGVAASTPRGIMSPQQWGTAVHTQMHHDIRRRYDPSITGVRSEFSLEGGAFGRYGALGSTRLDIYHHVQGTNTICVYDIKTGQAGLSSAQASRIYREARAFGADTGAANPHVLIIELRPTP